jgi:hypothetical protein
MMSRLEDLFFASELPDVTDFQKGIYDDQSRWDCGYFFHDPGCSDVGCRSVVACAYAGDGLRCVVRLVLGHAARSARRSLFLPVRLGWDRRNSWLGGGND